MNQRFVIALFSTAAVVLAQPASPVKPTPAMFRDLELRNIATSSASGRVSDIAVDPKNRSVWYVATASGGLWKTMNRGLNFQPIFDEGGSYSLGCVTVDPKNSNVVWLGTGENQSQRSVGYGDGVYKSTDAGKTWKKMGLADSEHIAKIIVDPRNSNVVWAASQGPLWAPGGDRGLYKTTDGGQTWKAMLQIGENTGITDIDIDPRNPDVIYAAAYQRRRNTSVLVAGGPESGVFKSTDGGAHWNPLNNGIPTVDKGRIAVAVSPQKPDVIYVTVTTSQANKQSGFFRSEDGGAHFTRMSDFVVADPQYYGEIYADPHQFDRVFMVDMPVQVTEDGGKTVKPTGWRVHTDNHAVTFDPDDANHFLVGNDGGLYESYDNGKNWRHFDNLLVTQFFRVTVDNGLPFYNIYGGTQDNGSLGAPSRNIDRLGIHSHDWMTVGGGDGFQARADPEDPNTVYACSQHIACSRMDLKTGVGVSIHPSIDDATQRSRWDIPFIISPHSHTRLYIAGNRLMRSDDRGAHWKFVSPDLTRNIDRETLPVMGKMWGPDAVFKHVFTDDYGTGTALAESPLKEGLLIVGTDDGLIQISEDSGQTWRKIEKFPGVPDLTYITDVFPSPQDANTIFVVFNDYQRGNFKPYLLKSTDLGRSWTSIAGNLPARDPLWSIVQDHINPNLLFVGTELTLSFSIDGGKNWVRLQGGAPVITFRDLEIQKRENDLVAGTFGRGFFVLDDYSPLRQMTPDTFTQEAMLFAPGRKARVYDELGYFREGGEVASPNPPFGAILTYYLRDALPAGADAPKLVLTVADANGKTIRQIDGVATAGVHRTAWDLRETAPPPPPSGGRGGGGRGGVRQGPMVKPGTFTVTLAKVANGAVTPLGASQKVEVAPLEPSNR